VTQLTLPQAAKATGKDRTTLYRAIKSGKVSASKNAAGDYQVDVAELIRVYGPLKAATLQTPAAEVAQQPGATAENLNATNDLLREVELLRLRNKELEADREERIEREKWLQAKLDELTPAVKLLTDQRPARGEPKPGFFMRLFGR
jgi:hypothetical protein